MGGCTNGAHSKGVLLKSATQSGGGMLSSKHGHIIQPTRMQVPCLRTCPCKSAYIHVESWPPFENDLAYALACLKIDGVDHSDVLLWRVLT